MNGPVEPPADLRQSAVAMHQMFIAYVDAGFTETQALELVKQFIPRVEVPPST